MQSQISEKREMPRKRKPLTQLSIEEATGSRKKSRTTETDDESESPTCSRRAGTVNYMILKNFMCHSLLEVDFKCNNISIVIGKNGSGKSAILTGLIVGLGGKASLTSRGSSVKGFVKVGKNSGSVEIQLCNEGPMAYRPRTYGKTITVIRNLSSSGGGSYRVKSAGGEVISTQAKEVLHITSNLNIQVDNPVCLLTQDTSRNFLSSNDPKNKFMLFMRATRLEMLEIEYKKILSNKKDSAKILDDKKNNFQKLQEEIRKLKQKIDGHQSIVNMKERKMLFQNEMMWAQVRDLEEELEGEEKKMEKIQKKKDDFRNNARKKEHEVETIQESINDYERQITELKDQLEIQSRPQNDIKRQLEELQNAYNAKKREKQAVAIEIESKNKDAEYLEREIANANENMSKVEQQKRQRMHNLTKLQEKLKGFDDHLETARNELFQIKSDLSRKQDDENSLKTEIKQIEQKIANEMGNLQALQKESGNTLMLYGRNIPKVKEMIKQYKNQFQHEPRGPLGSYIKLKDKKWAVAVEGFLGAGNLCAFTVDNQKDNQILQQIFQRILQGDHQPTIITSKFIFKKHDVNKNLVQSPKDCVSLYEAVGISDPIVSNCIVDQMSTENILLVPDNERAMALLSDKNRVPRNCKQGLTMGGDKYYPDPNYKTYASNYHRAQYLQVDTNEHILLLQENVNNSTNKKQVVQNQLQALQREIAEHSRKQRELEKKIQKVMLAKSQIRRQYDDLSNEAEPEVHDLNNLENELQDIKRTLNEKNASLGKTVEEMREIKADILAMEEKLEQMKKATKALDDRIWPLQDQVKEYLAKKRQMSTNDEFDKRRLDEYEKKVNEARSVVILKQAQVKLKDTEASKLGKRPAELRKVQYISAEISDISRAITRIEMETDDIIKVTQRYRELMDKYKQVADIMRGLFADLDELSQAVERRKKHYKITENYFVTFMKHSFKKILEFRQFKGTIEINMDQKKLDLVVMPQQGSQGLTTTSNLSGGERSFSTVAFLYSLWQCMDFPFYFLDEFDVYMDKLNRTKVIDILLHHANSKPDLQFVFLTPQDVSFISQNVSILRLQDPERFKE